MQINDDPIFGNELEGEKVYAWHKDTFTTGRGTRLIKGVVYDEQAVKFSENVYGVQFHPEVTPEVIEKWYARDLEDNPSLKEIYPCIFEETEKAATYLPPVHAWLENFLARLFR